MTGTDQFTAMFWMYFGSNFCRPPSTSTSHRPGSKVPRWEEHGQEKDTIGHHLHLVFKNMYFSVLRFPLCAQKVRWSTRRPGAGWVDIDSAQDPYDESMSWKAGILKRHHGSWCEISNILTWLTRKKQIAYWYVRIYHVRDTLTGVSRISQMIRW